MLRKFSDARSYTWLSIAAALVTMALKFFAYQLTGSVGLLSDAVESVVNLVAALVALWALWLAGRPADEEHHYGHSKAEYFSSGLEGALILVAAASIAIAAWPRLFHPQPLEQIGLGLGISAVASALNGGVAWMLWQGGKRYRSVTLNADARHLLTDVWTTVGVIVAVALVSLTGWLILDPLIALAVAANVLWTGLRLIRESGYGLLDTALPQVDQDTIARVLAPYRSEGIEFHALRTRSSGARRFVSLHVLVPGSWTVQQGHDLCERIEMALHREMSETTVFTHLEPREDPAAWDDQGLDRQLEDTSSQI
ncbi:MAG TPA: cation diffusion facilitator family transporter [Ktedonobacterales bacterium]|nr:cation diffusion facilitator family transporter [Ktedonobacterales bacterium]